jgi:3-methyl-2-oxobutanoate hydroxymethyltransferase
MSVTIRDIQAMKERGEKIAMLTAYDYATARLLDAAGVPLLLVGDSLGMVVLGYASTIPVTLEEMLHHTRAVSRGAARALVVGDMPFMTYSITEAEALRNAARFLQEGGASAVKLEGGGRMAATVQRLIESGIPVMGHLGLTPQSLHQLGGFRAQARSAGDARRLLDDALRLEDAGAFALVLECIPAELAKVVSERLRIPTIGIGAGPHCDGQVQVLHDLLGLITDFVPKHAKRYAHLAAAVQDAVTTYLAEVREGTFPTAEHSVTMSAESLAEVLEAAAIGQSGN